MCCAIELQLLTLIRRRSSFLLIGLWSLVAVVVLFVANDTAQEEASAAAAVVVLRVRAPVLKAKAH